MKTVELFYTTTQAADNIRNRLDIEPEREIKEISVLSTGSGYTISTFFDEGTYSVALYKK